MDGFTWFKKISSYVNMFFVELNVFWLVLSNEILWFIWKKRNEEVFQGKIRCLSFILNFPLSILFCRCML